MLEPRRRLGCCASSIACLFFVINIIILVCAAVFGGFAVYFSQGALPASLGMQDVRLVLVVIGSALGIVSVLGMLVTAEDSRWLAKLYSILMVLVMILQSVAGVYLIMLQSQLPSRIHTAWNGLDEAERHYLELRMICCGFDNVSDSPKCTVSKTQACGPLIVQTQTPVFSLLSTICLVFVGVQVSCLLMSHYLANQYKKLNSRRLSTLSSPIPPPFSPFVKGQPTTTFNAATNNNIPVKGESLAHHANNRHTLPDSFRNATLFSPTLQMPSNNRGGGGGGGTTK